MTCCLSPVGDIEQETPPAVTILDPVAANLIVPCPRLDLVPRPRAMHVAVPEDKAARLVDIDVVPKPAMSFSIGRIAVELGVFDYYDAIGARVGEQAHFVVVKVAVADGQALSLGTYGCAVMRGNSGPGKLQVLHGDSIPLDDPDRLALGGPAPCAQVRARTDAAQGQAVLAPDRHVSLVFAGRNLYQGAVARGPRSLAGTRVPLPRPDLQDLSFRTCGCALFGSRPFAGHYRSHQYQDQRQPHHRVSRLQTSILDAFLSGKARLPGLQAQGDKGKKNRNSTYDFPYGTQLLDAHSWTPLRKVKGRAVHGR